MFITYILYYYKYVLESYINFACKLSGPRMRIVFCFLFFCVCGVFRSVDFSCSSWYHLHILCKFGSDATSVRVCVCKYIEMREYNSISYT